MYQLEVKRWLVQYYFPPSNGWKVFVHIDPMERAHGGLHKPDKAARACIAENALKRMGATTNAHPEFNRVDIVAIHPDHGIYIVEVEGKSSRQKEQAVYSALGQLMLRMQGEKQKFVLAVPDQPAWEKQIKKIPANIKRLMNLHSLLVSEQKVREE